MEENMCKIGLGLRIASCHQEMPPAKLHFLFPPCMKEEEKKENDQKVLFKKENTETTVQPKKNDKHKNDKEEEEEEEEEEEKGGTRKKLRLTKEQSSFLEESFRANKMLTLVQKHELAEKLHLLPRQVEIWFQNRRARTKLKQTETDREFLKKWCESLGEENRRLRREMQQLRFHAEVDKIKAMRVCPSCVKFMHG
ncbi:Homeobox-leucine zipper protein HOX7 [Apostasia shenzhenica]|uniref:Homeobox-leucine zipper protein HOX7 n=1 Tax=Apostasia shenzhenica TaxID=1088818 RepID=A0A2I0APM6_9ASPA|nr:Homeobox-leucine zipper protein HOX7 [Apostasia shenzhenica]